MYDTDKAHFYECDVKSRENLNEVVGSITKKVGDVSVLLNCSSTSIVSTYFDVRSVMLCNLISQMIFICFAGLFDTFANHERKQERNARVYSHN